MELSQVKHHIRAIQTESTVEQQKGDGRQVKCLEMLDPTKKKAQVHSQTTKEEKAYRN